MKKHQYVKRDCDCARRATYFVCRHCGNVEYASPDELRRVPLLRATCTDAGAPLVPPAEKFRASLGGVFDCLAPDFADHEKTAEPSPAPE